MLCALLSQIAALSPARHLERYIERALPKWAARLPKRALGIHIGNPSQSSRFACKAARAEATVTQVCARTPRTGDLSSQPDGALKWVF